MRDVLIMTHLMDFAGGPESGSWYEKGHYETKFIKAITDKKGADEMSAYHVLLTREEYDDLCNDAGGSE